MSRKAAQSAARDARTLPEKRIMLNGGFMSQEDMEVIDLGVPLLSMHATFEMASKVDVWNFYRFMFAFYRS